MGVSPLLDRTDVARMMRVLDGLHDAAAGADARWRRLLGGVCELVGAVAAVLAIGPHAGGWTATHRHGLDAPAAGALIRRREGVNGGGAVAEDPALRRLLRLSRGLAAGATLTRSRRELVADDARWYADPHVRDVRGPLGLDDGIYSACGMAGGAVACLCIFAAATPAAGAAPAKSSRRRRGQGAG